MSSLSIPPSRGSIVPPGEIRTFVRGVDGTRLFLRTQSATDAESSLQAVLCDGLMCDGFIWKYQWNDLRHAMNVAHWNYRGHGRSAQPADPERVTIVDHADDLTEVRKHLGDGPCVLFGHSMGCQVVLENYHRRPENIHGLVLECGSFGKVTSTFHGTPILDLILPKLIDAAVKAPHVVRALWSRIPHEMALKWALRTKELDPERINPADVLPYLEHMTQIDFPMFLQMLKSAGEHSASDYLAAIDIPVLIIAGERDTFTPAFLAERMRDAIPASELLVLKNGSHVGPLEQHELVAETIDRFVKERVLPRLERSSAAG